jgi:hypothetical protein
MFSKKQKLTLYAINGLIRTKIKFTTRNLLTYIQIIFYLRSERSQENARIQDISIFFRTNTSGCSNIII